MNTSFERVKNSSDEWYTPKYIIDSLGDFDLDPCAPISPIYRTAKTMFNKNDDGLTKQWEGRIWLNPPYSRPLIEKFVNLMAEHGNGIALLFNRCDSKLFQDVIFKKAKAILFMKGRIKFLNQNGDIVGSPGRGSVLVAFGSNNAEILKTCGIDGKFFYI